MGSPTTLPLSADELVGWAAHDKLTAWEQEKASKRRK